MYCVFYHDQKFHKYYIYYAHDNKYEESFEIPNKCDNFEHSRLTKISINDKLSKGFTMQDILKEYSDKRKEWRDELLTSKSLILPYDDFAIFKKDNGEKFINTNESNILRFFNKYSSKIYTNKTFDPITWNEYLWYKKQIMQV